MGQKHKRIRQKERQYYADDQERRYEKSPWDQIDSHEIPDWGETSEIPPASLRAAVADGGIRTQS